MEKTRQIIQEAIETALSPEKFPHFKEYTGLDISQVPSEVLIPWLNKHSHEFIHQKRVQIIKDELKKRGNIPNITPSNYDKSTIEDLITFFEFHVDKRKKTISEEADQIASLVIENLYKLQNDLTLNFGEYEGVDLKNIPQDYLRNVIVKEVSKSHPDAKKALIASPENFFKNNKTAVYYTALSILKNFRPQIEGDSQFIGEIEGIYRISFRVEEIKIGGKYNKFLIKGHIGKNNVLGITGNYSATEVSVGDLITFTGKVQKHKIFRNEKYTLITFRDFE